MSSVVFGHFSVFLSVVSMLGFAYLYIKDKDERKLMFLIAFFFGVLSNLPKMMINSESVLVLENMTLMGPLPLVVAFFIAGISGLFQLKDFGKQFKIYFVSVVITSFLIIAPINVEFIPVTFYPILSTSAVFISLFTFLRNRKLTNLLFLGSIITVVGAEIGRNLISSGLEFIIFAYTIAHICLFSVFIASKESNSDDISSFFSLQRELKDTKEELQNTKKKLVNVENIFNASPDAIAVSDENGIIIDNNYATVELLGLGSKDELIGKNSLAFVAKKDQEKIKEIFKNIAKDNATRNVEYVAVKKDGTEFSAELSATTINDFLGDVKGFVVIAKDISERKKSENLLKKYSEDLEELVEERTRALKESQELLVKSERMAAIGQAATMVGHDLRNPLQAIENAAHLLNRDLSKNKMPKKTEKTIQALNKAVEYADNIVRSLQCFTSIRKPVLVKANLNVMIRDIFSFVKKPDYVELIIKTEELEPIECDVEMIKRVFVNLATNGIQAIDQNDGRLEVTTKTEGDFAVVTFKDSGVGISKENQKKIFTAFFTTKAQGMGVGLAICKRFVELHGGKIDLFSEEGKGAEFKVYLPIKKIPILETI